VSVDKDITFCFNLFKFEVQKILYISVGTSSRHDGNAPHFLADFVTLRHVDGNHMPVVRET
jgi:hypothetical protein